jgi:glutamate/tyrosine decarboxylase-like PLP-dependent enzyme
MDAGTRDLLIEVAEATSAYLDSLGERSVRAELTAVELRRRLDRPLDAGGADDRDVIRSLAELGAVATVATAGPRYFGFVNGGSLPVALAAELLAVGWDQNAAMAVMSPMASVAEEVAGRWILELLGLDPSCSIGFVTGGQSATTTCLAAARNHVLGARGWDVEVDGLVGGPTVTTIVGEHRHATVDAALRVLGFGSPSAVVGADGEGRMRPDLVEEALAAVDGPTIICVQAGNVVTGSFDPMVEIVELASRVGAWVHVDGAFGGWAAAAPSLRHLTAGMAGADSWSVDGHKLLNVPYDSGYAITAHPESHRAACTSMASYYVVGSADEPRDGMMWVLDASRRARGVATYAALLGLGRDGVADLIERLCALARLFADLVGDVEGIEVVNDVVLNQVAVRFGADDAHTEAVIAALQDDGTCWAGGARWDDRAVMRWSVANWSTTAEDIERSAAAVIRLHRAVGGGPPPT